MKFVFEIIERRRRVIEVEADDLVEAERKAENLYTDEKIVLDDGDWLDFEINRV